MAQDDDCDCPSCQFNGGLITKDEHDRLVYAHFYIDDGPPDCWVCWGGDDNCPFCPIANFSLASGIYRENKEYKQRLERTHAIHCGYCRYHRGENATYYSRPKTDWRDKAHRRDVPDLWDGWADQD